LGRYIFVSSFMIYKYSKCFVGPEGFEPPAN
jgi:hypothetical protein